MKQVLIYADSLTWGLIPNTRQRLSFDKRWPGVFESYLNKNKKLVRVVENCLNGRKTVWSDPFKDGRNGSIGLAQEIEKQSPLALVILMLGTNDFQCTHNNNAWLSAQGMAKLVGIIRQAPIEPEMPIPTIMIVAPPAITKPKGLIAHKFKDAELRCVGLAKELKKVANQLNTLYFDANSVAATSAIDGVHLDEEQHSALGLAIAKTTLPIL